MKKLKALSRAAVVPALVLGTSFAPFALNSGIAHAQATDLYWYGTGSAYPGAAATYNAGAITASLAANTESNWSTSPTAYSQDTDTGSWATGVTLHFNTGTSAQSISGQVTGSPSGVDVVHGGITLTGNVTATPMTLNSGAVLTVETPSTATDYLKAGVIADSGALTLNGIAAANLPTGNISGTTGTSTVTGPLTLKVTDTGVTAPYAYNATQLGNLLGSASASNLLSVDFGLNTSINLATTDFSANNAAQYWTLEADGDGNGNGGTITLAGGTTPTAYPETITVNGGTIGVNSGTGTANVTTIHLKKDSLAAVPLTTDQLTSTNFDPSTFKFTAANGSNGKFPTQASGVYAVAPTGTTPTGTTPTGTTPTGTTPAASATATTPKTPDTGLALVAAHPLTSLIVSAMAAGALFFTARRLKPAARR